MKLPSDYPANSPFIFHDKGEAKLELRSTRESVKRLAEVIRFFHHSRAASPVQPISFPASHPMAPELIAGCWQAGVPYWAAPEPVGTEADQRARELLNPLAYDWQQAIQLYLDEYGETFAPQPSTVDETAFFCYIFTSGSTGKAKLTGLKRSQMITAATLAGQNFRPEQNECWLLCLPLNHIGGAAVVLRSWLYGNSVVDARHSTPEMLAGQFRHNESLTVASLVPTQLLQLMQLTRGELVHPAFKTILLGGGPASIHLTESARKHHIPVIKSYGMTETCAQIAAVPFAQIYQAPAESSGKLFAGHQASVRDEQEQEVPQGESGLLWLRGPQLISSYAANSSSESSFDANGWFNTGDYGRVDEDGWLYIEMRRSDLIISGGENINPMEIEGAVREAFPGLEDMAVSSLPDEVWGQKMICYIVPGSVPQNADAILKVLKLRLPAFKVPKEIRFLETLPRNSMGKLLRDRLPKT